MDEHIRRALARGLTCDITTTGRRSGRPSRIEIWYFFIEGQVYITGTPGPRDWYANLLVNPQLTFHLKEGVHADLPAHTRIISEPAERRRIMSEIMRRNSWFKTQHYSLDDWVAGSPLVLLEFNEG